MGEFTAFWGLEVLPGKKFVQEPEHAFRLTRAVLTDIVDAKERTMIYVMIDDKTKFCIAALTPEKDQAELSLDLGVTESVTFFVKGKNTVHLTGYQYWLEDFDGSDDEDEMGYPIGMRGGDSDDSEEFSDMSDDDEIEMNSAGKIRELGSDEDSEGSDDDSEEEEEEAPKQQKGDTKKRAAEAAPEPKKAAKVEEKKPEQKKPEPKKQEQTPKKQEQQTPKKQEQEKPQTPKTTEKKSDVGLTKTLAGGLEVTDIEIGSGKKAKAGKKVKMLYRGKLANGKVFDECKDRHKPFVFRLGVGEVIKGWDMGIADMFVGGKRKLKIPAPLGYGKKGAGKDIPPNSTLLFDVELVDCE